MIFEIRFTPEAEQTYEAVVHQLQSRWSYDFVIKFEKKVEKTLNTISTTPYIFPILDETTEIRRCVLHKNCSMLYSVYDTIILIICFWDNRQEPLLA